MTTETRRILAIPVAAVLLLVGACTGSADEHDGMAGMDRDDHAAMSSSAAPAASSSAAESVAAKPSSAADATVIAPGRPGEPNATLSGTAAVPPTTPLEPADVIYMQDMIVHHSQAVELVDLTEGRLVDATVTALAARIGAEQVPEMQGMAQWLEQQGQEVPMEASMEPGEHTGHDMTGHEGMPGMATEEQLQALRDAPADQVDRLFLTLMIRHHEGAIDMVVERSKVGTDPTVELLANDTAATQQVQIDQMQAMLDRLG